MLWFSVVCTPIDNDINHSGHNVDLWWRISLSIRVQKPLNYILFLFYHNIQGGRHVRVWIRVYSFNVKVNVYFRACPRSEKERAKRCQKLASNMIGLFPKMTRTALSRLLISQSDSEITGICCLFLISCYFVTLLQKVHYKKGISLGVSKTKNLRPRKLEKSNSKPSTLGLKLVFRPRV